jgi:hypothetical protein
LDWNIAIPETMVGPMDSVADKRPPGWLTESLERSEAQIAAGQTVPMDPVLARLRASIARMRAKGAPAQPETEPNTAGES